MKEKLILKNLGPLKESVLEPRKLTIIIGEQATGKSLAAQLLYFFRGLKYFLAKKYKETSFEENWQERVIRELLYELRGVRFGYFANDTAHLIYQKEDKTWQITIYGKSQRVRPLKQLRLDITSWFKKWHQDKEALGKERSQTRQFFIPTEGPLITLFIVNEPGVLFSSYQPLFLKEFANAISRSLEIYDGLIHQKTYPSDVIFLLNKQKEALGGMAYVPKKGVKVWKWQLADKKKVLPIEAVSSGQMEAWPFFVMITTFGVLYKDAMFYLEEPETHLHPRAQVKVMETIGYLVNQGRQFVITTHSPFILYVVNNMIQRWLSYKGNVPEGQIGLNPEDVTAYQFKEESQRIIDRDETGLIDVQELERIADALGEEFDRLLALENE